MLLLDAQVNLWAVAHSRVEPLNARKDSLKSTEMPIGFEHALSVDLAELIGGAGSVTNGGGGSHIALLGNLLAVATEHAVFLVNLSFDVKGEDNMCLRTWQPFRGYQVLRRGVDTSKRRSLARTVIR